MRYYSADERRTIEALIKQGKGPTYIAKALGRSMPSIKNEIKRFGGAEAYDAEKIIEERPACMEEKYKRVSQTLKAKCKPAGVLLRERVESLEMQIQIILETLNEVKNGKN